jgi:hypothetical protein
MRLLRALSVRLTPTPADFKRLSAQGDAGLVVRTLGASEQAGGGLYVLLLAEIGLTQFPKKTKEGDIVVPERERRSAQTLLEEVANAYAVSHNTQRELGSPFPYVGFWADSEEDTKLLENAHGIHGHVGRAWPSFPIRLGASDKLMTALAGRMDGAALLAEAKSCAHLTGRFHEFVRLFERAFKRPADKHLVSRLVQVTTPYFEYSTDEIRGWVDLRGPATHADVRPEFALEGDVRHVIDRMEQAAYDVLLNKANWRSDDTNRREVWFPAAGTIGANQEGYIVMKDTTPLTSQILDQWGDYPLDLQNWHTSDDWWPKNDSQFGAQVGTVSVVEAPPGVAVWGVD